METGEHTGTSCGGKSIPSSTPGTCTTCGTQHGWWPETMGYTSNVPSLISAVCWVGETGNHLAGGHPPQAEDDDAGLHPALQKCSIEVVVQGSKM
jgi:hypothetical protein